MSIPIYINKDTRFLYYFCLCKSFKELSFSSPSGRLFPESGCKGTTFFRTTKTFSRKISLSHTIFCRSWCKSKRQTAYTLFIYIRIAFYGRKNQFVLFIRFVFRKQALLRPVPTFVSIRSDVIYDPFRWYFRGVKYHRNGRKTPSERDESPIGTRRKSHRNEAKEAGDGF